MRKQMQGDNQRRRTLARQAREAGQRPSQAGATLGSTKRPEHLDRKRREGPPPAGGHKPDSTRGGPAPPPSAPRPATWPRPVAGLSAPGVTTIGYRELVDEVGQRSGVDFDEARVAARATVLALAGALDEQDRERLLDAVPAQLRDGTPLEQVNPHHDLAGFLAEVARISNRTPEQARYQAEATLATLAGQDGDLVASLELPDALRELLTPPAAGGGLVDPSGASAVLTEEELRAALADLPYWSGDQRALSRTIALPPANLDRVLGRLELLRQEYGRGPGIGRQTEASAVLTVWTRSVDAVTALDVDLAHRIDDAIDEAGAGMASG